MSKASVKRPWKLIYLQHMSAWVVWGHYCVSMLTLTKELVAPLSCEWFKPENSWFLPWMTYISFWIANWVILTLTKKLAAPIPCKLSKLESLGRVENRIELGSCSWDPMRSFHQCNQQSLCSLQVWLGEERKTVTSYHICIIQDFVQQTTNNTT